MKYYTNLQMNGNYVEDANLVRPVIFNLSTPPVAAVEGQIYFNTVDKELYEYNGSDWIKLRTNAVISTSANEISVEGNSLTNVCIYKGAYSTTSTYNIGDIVKYINTTTSVNVAYICKLPVVTPGAFNPDYWEELGGGGGGGTGGPVLVMKQATPEAGFAATYYVIQNGIDVPCGEKINIPKDFLVKRAALKTVQTFVPNASYLLDDLVQCTSDVYRVKVAGTYATQADLIDQSENLIAGTGHANEKYLVFIINAKDASETEQSIYVNLADLVGVYVGGNGIKITGNEISASYDETSIKKDANNKLYVSTHVAGSGETPDIILSVAADGLTGTHFNSLKDESGTIVSGDVDTYSIPYIKMDKKGHIKQFKDGTPSIEKQNTPSTGSKTTYKLKNGSTHSGSAIEIDQVAITTAATPTTGYAKSYDFYQGDSTVATNKIGRIDIPKDMRLVGAEVKVVVKFSDPAIVIGDLLVESPTMYDAMYRVLVPPDGTETFAAWSSDPTKSVYTGDYAEAGQQVFEFAVNEKDSIATPEYVYASVEGVGGGTYSGGIGISITTSNVINADRLVGASSSADGKEGIVPTPYKGEENLFLRGDGQWKGAAPAFGTGTIDVGYTSTTITIPVGSYILGSVMLQNGEQVLTDLALDSTTGVITVSTEEAVATYPIEIKVIYAEP